MHTTRNPESTDQTRFQRPICVENLPEQGNSLVQIEMFTKDTTSNDLQLETHSF